MEESEVVHRSERMIHASCNESECCIGTWDMKVGNIGVGMISASCKAPMTAFEDWKKGAEMGF